MLFRSYWIFYFRVKILSNLSYLHLGRNVREHHFGDEKRAVSNECQWGHEEILSTAKKWKNVNDVINRIWSSLATKEWTEPNAQKLGPWASMIMSFNILQLWNKVLIFQSAQQEPSYRTHKCCTRMRRQKEVHKQPRS